MRVLIANDDGIFSTGIAKLTEALGTIEETEIYVCAPRTQQSGKSHSISMSKPMEVTELAFSNAKLALSVNGTPADCVMLGLRYLQAKGIDIDMVFSGINEGSNLGTDTIYSGTVGAAMEGALCGKPSVAVSVETHSPTHFEAAQELAVQAYYRVKEMMDPMTVININTPDIPKEEIKGVKVTRVGRREYDAWFDSELSGGVRRYRYGGDPVVYKSKNTDIDVIAVQEGYASVTPLMFDLTAHDKLEEIRRWKLDV
ncbi:MAG: 5'/3'-nucleotidase SurE [Anaerovoracaceae bacterium]|nr:5'/3'-nucleotidase SurE [Anaerovoracaceae bacterium]